jgi:hypothetical protein
MPLAKDLTLSSDRLEFYESLSKKEIEHIVADRNVKSLQSSKPVDAFTWQLINEILLENRPDIEIRVYGHYSQVCDLSFLARIPNVRNLSLDCLLNADGIENIISLQNLDILSVGIYNLKNFSFLDRLPKSISSMSLGATRSKKPDLKPIENFKSLKKLYIEGQQRNIDAIGELHGLEELTLRSVSPKNISFIRQLKNLWSLDIKLGGIKDISQLTGLDNLKYLELWQINGLADISVISSLTGLQILFLQSLRNISALPDMSELKRLRRVYLETMKGLKDVSGLLNAPILEEFIHVCAQNMQPSQYYGLLKNGSLKKALVGFGSEKKNTAFEEKMKEHHIEKYSHIPFLYL